CGVSYSFNVTAYDAAGYASAHSTAVTASTSPCAVATITSTTSSTTAADTTAPTVPAGLRGTAVTASSVSLAWDPSSDNVGVAGYNVYENGIAYPVNWVASVPQGTSYTVRSLGCGSSNSFNVTAYDADGNASAH